jgi:hypothetical protein
LDFGYDTGRRQIVNEAQMKDRTKEFAKNTLSSFAENYPIIERED